MIVIVERQQQVPFSEVSARAALLAASRALGLEAAYARLLGPVADNAVFLLPGRVVGRVSSSSAMFDRARHELRIGQWLASQGVPAVRPLDDVEQPVIVNGRVVTFWREVQGATMASTVELGTALARLHALAEPSDFELAPLDPFARVTERLEAAAPQLGPAGARFLGEYAANLRVEYTRLRFASPLGVIHGDPNRKNVLRDHAGVIVLIDLERFSRGPCEWDLVVPAVYRRIGWYTEDEYLAFASAYGRDVMAWDGFPVLAAIRELRMTLWLATRVRREPRLTAELRRRLASLRNPSAPRVWKPGV